MILDIAQLRSLYADGDFRACGHLYDSGSYAEIQGSNENGNSIYAFYWSLNYFDVVFFFKPKSVGLKMVKPNVGNVESISRNYRHVLIGGHYSTCLSREFRPNPFRISTFAVSLAVSRISGYKFQLQNICA